MLGNFLEQKSWESVFSLLGVNILGHLRVDSKKQYKGNRLTADRMGEVVQKQRRKLLPRRWSNSAQEGSVWPKLSVGRGGDSAVSVRGAGQVCFRLDLLELYERKYMLNIFG